MSTVDALFKGFSKLNRKERFQRLVSLGALTPEDVQYLMQGGTQDLALGERLIENVIGYFQLPLGVATNFCIDGQDVVIPMAVEETSIIAALSKTARWIRQFGCITTQVTGDCIIGQIQLACVHDWERLSAIFNNNKATLIQLVNTEVVASMVTRGGGVKDLHLRCLSRNDGKTMAVIHLLMDSCDAMGANIINQALEYLKVPLEQMLGESVSICILSNLNDQKLTKAMVTIADVDAELGDKIQEASLFAEADPYRAATHNKGVMNGMDPVVIATGNDWRAIEAGVHAYAARTGQYQPISTWRYNNGVLVGELIAPIVVGVVGGVTALHPTAKMCLNMMQIKSANHLSRIIAAVGLVQNLGALVALCTEGIIQGHMKLHIDNIVMNTDANEHEAPILKSKLQQWLIENRRVSVQIARDILTQQRQRNNHEMVYSC